MISPEYRKPGEKFPLTFKPIKKRHNIFPLKIHQQKLWPLKTKPIYRNKFRCK
jgi:hypothetical protein